MYTSLKGFNDIQRCGAVLKTMIL